MKRKIICMFLSLAVLLSFSPLFTIQAEAFSTGSTRFIKTKTVTIKPGKTYKSPKFKLKKKMLIQVPIHVTTKSNKSTITKGGYTMSVKNSKNKTVASFKDSLVDIGGQDGFDYEDWIYFYNKSKNPCFSKGKYSISIKNTSNKTIKVKYSIKGYTKYAGKAEFKKNMTVDYGSDTAKFEYFDAMLPYIYVGRIGPGLPVIDKIKTVKGDVYADAMHLTHDGKLYLYIDTNKNEAEGVLSIKLLNRKTPYKINVKVKGSNY